MRSDKPGGVGGGGRFRRPEAQSPEPGVCGADLPPVVGSVLTGTGLTIAQAAARLERGEEPALSDVQRAIVERWIAGGRTG